METALVEVMPAPEVSVADMAQYGYFFQGVVPMGGEAAKEHFHQGRMLVYALHPDGTETVVGNERQLQRHIENGGLFAVDKQDWMKYLENGEYLRAAEISEEQNYDMIDGRKNNQPEQSMQPEQSVKEPKANDARAGKTSVLGRLKEKQELLAKTEKKEAPAPVKKPERDVP
jgi:hypothetical protein